MRFCQHSPPSTFRRPWRCCARILRPIARASACGVHPLKLFPLTSSWLAVASKRRAVLPVSKPFSLPAVVAHVPFSAAQSDESIRESGIRFGFWAFLPLRVRPSFAGLTPRSIRCSCGFRLSRDFALPAADPFSRACRSPTYATDRQPARYRSAVFPAGRSAFPRFNP